MRYFPAARHRAVVARIRGKGSRDIKLSFYQSATGNSGNENSISAVYHL